MSATNVLVFCAPYSPRGRSSKPHLGAARKIEILLYFLSRIFSNIIFVNSAHNSLRKSGLTVHRQVIGGVLVQEVTPPCWPSRKLGKLANLFHVQKTLNAVLELGEPQVVWVYNCYAFEALFTKAISRSVGCPVILEFEDWPLARERGLNPKPYIDKLAWSSIGPYIHHVFAVNRPLAERVSCWPGTVSLLPGIVPDGLVSIATGRKPFSDGASEIVVGFFGGLTREKGADLILEIAESIPDGYRMLVTGRGEFENEFRRRSSETPNRLSYCGDVSEHDLYQLISRCDVIVNPHRPIESMANGVFPFKVIEAIASGRVLVSTPLPTTDLEDTFAGVIFVGHDRDALLKGILRARDFYSESRQKVELGAQEARSKYGETAFLSELMKVIKQ